MVTTCFNFGCLLSFLYNLSSSLFCVVEGNSYCVDFMFLLVLRYLYDSGFFNSFLFPSVFNFHEIQLKSKDYRKFPCGFIPFLSRKIKATRAIGGLICPRWLRRIKCLWRCSPISAHSGYYGN